jgi:hypothetical protein
MPAPEKEWMTFFNKMDEKNLKLDEREVYDEVQTYRAEKRRR